MPIVIGRYALFDELASGGMATVYLGRLVAAQGFARTVAIKRLHTSFSKDPDFVKMLFDEARLTARVRHPNVVTMLDVIAEGGELCLVMEYVHGFSLSQVMRIQGRGKALPPRIACGIVAGMAHGLHAAHEATDEMGHPLDIVHRDVSPQNLLIARDGVPRVLDFGIAKASGQLHTTREGTLKGKIPYMAPEQVYGHALDRRTDIYAATVVLWECLTGRPLFRAESEVALIQQVLAGPDAITLAGEVPPGLREIIVRGVAREPARRFANAKEMALALEPLGANASEVGDWLASIAQEPLAQREALVRKVESASIADKSSALAVIDSIADADHTEKENAPPVRSPDAVKLEAATNVWGVQETHISVGADVTVSEPRKPRRRGMVLAAFALVATPVVWIVATHHVTPVSSSTVTAVASDASSAPRVLAAPPLTIETIPEPSLPQTAASATASARTPTPTTTTSRATAPTPCSPPTFVDANGIRRVKAGCGDHARSLR